MKFQLKSDSISKLSTDIIILAINKSNELCSSLSLSKSFQDDLNLIIKLDEKLFNITKDIDFSELCITSTAKVEKTSSSEVSAISKKAEGDKCPVCWKISKNACERHPI